MKLSICIATYNRAEFLEENLQIIEKQLTQSLVSEVEIIVGDNGSTDDTLERVRRFQKLHANCQIRVLAHGKNLGHGRNILSVIGEAKGEYCWLLGDDDYIVKGAIQKLLGLFLTHPTVPHFLINYSRFDYRARAITAERMIGLNADIYFRNCNEFFFYKAPEDSYFYFLGANTITMSVNIFKRETWQKILEGPGNMEQFIPSNMIHIFMLAKMNFLFPEIYFVGEPLVQYLSNNHRAWDNDIWKDYFKKQVV